MIRKFTFIFLSFFIFSAVNAQVIFEDDFESYTDGNPIAQTASSNWDTWSGATGGAEDGLVSTAQAASGMNSLYVSGTNDVLLRLDDQPMEAGRYKVTFKMFIAADNYGYFNLLHSFAGTNSSWATQTWFRPNGSCSTDAGADDAAQFTQNTGEWFNVTYIVDLEDDFSTFYHNTDEVVSWKWSGGSFGSGTEKTFEALNFYAWPDEGTPGFYIDDIKVEQVDKPGGGEITLEATLNASNQIEVNWSSANADEYFLTNYGDEFARTADTFELIEKPYPQLYDFKVGAHFDLAGYQFSESVELDMPGGRERDFVLFEGATGTWCVYCPAAARGLDQLHDEGFDVGIIEYHNGDDYVNAPGTNRISYYGVNAFPTTFADGELSVEGGGLTGTLFPNFEADYNQRKLRRSLYSLDMTLINLGGNEYKIQIESEELYSYFEGPINLRISLTESDIPDVWFNLTEVDFVNRDMYPDAVGTEFEYASGLETYEHTFTLDSSYIVENCEVVAFLQYDDTKEILNGAVIPLEDAIISSVNETLSAQVDIMPNPVLHTFQIEGLSEGKATIFSMDGKQVYQFEINSDAHQESISFLNAGSYLLRIATEEGIVSKVIIKK